MCIILDTLNIWFLITPHLLHIYEEGQRAGIKESFAKTNNVTVSSIGLLEELVAGQPFCFKKAVCGMGKGIGIW